MCGIDIIEHNYIVYIQSGVPYEIRTLIRDYISSSTKKSKPAQIITQLKRDQHAGKFEADIPIPTARQISGFVKTLSKEFAPIKNYQELLYWAKAKLCECTEKYNEWENMSSLMVLKVPKFEDVEEEDDQGNMVSNSTVCIVLSSKEILESAKKALFTSDNQPIDTVLKMDATFKLANNGWLLSPLCTETARFEPPHRSSSGLKRTGHKHVILPIAFLVHTTENTVPYKHALKLLVNIPNTHFGFPVNIRFCFKWFVADNSRQAQNAAKDELGEDVIILNCQDHLLRKFNDNKVKVRDTDNISVIEPCIRAMSRAATANIHQYIFEIVSLYANVWNEVAWCKQFEKYYMNEVNCRWYDTASGTVSLALSLSTLISVLSHF